MKSISFDQWIFSIKLFVAAMLAYVISVHLGLAQNYWAMVTCCVVMNPMTGGVRSKAVYRFTGTILAGVAGVLLVAALGSISLLIIIGAGLMASSAFGLAMLDRTPRAYGFQLFGVTLLLIAVGGIDHPESVFDTALARVCEIGLGVICSAVVDSIIVPRSLRPTLIKKLQSVLPDMERWIDDMLNPHASTETVIRDRNRILADVTSMSVLIGQLRYDPMVSKWERQCACAIQQKLLRLIPLLPTITAYFNHLDPSAKPGLEEWLKNVRQLARERRLLPDTCGENSAIKTPDSTLPTWQDLLQGSLIELVANALKLWSEVHGIVGALEGVRELDPVSLAEVQAANEFRLKPDLYMAGRVAAGVLLAYAVLAAAWWLTGWHQGANALILGIVAVGFFGGVDEAGKAIAGFAKFAAASLVLAGVLSYGLLPLTSGLGSFMLVMGLVMIPLGLWAAKNPMAVLLLALALSNLNLQVSYSPLGFDEFLDAALSTIIGVLVAQLCIKLVRQMGAKERVRRFVQFETADIAGLTRHADPRSIGAYTLRALDRAASIGTRTISQTKEVDVGGRALDGIQVGVAVATIRSASRNVGGLRRRTCEALLVHLRQELQSNTPPSAMLRELLDGALLASFRRTPLSTDPLVRGLIALRLFLFIHSSDLKN